MIMMNGNEEKLNCDHNLPIDKITKMVGTPNASG